jgi:hypothetical protein
LKKLSIVFPEPGAAPRFGAAGAKKKMSQLVVEGLVISQVPTCAQLEMTP